MSHYNLSHWAYTLEDFDPDLGWPDPVPVPALDGNRCHGRDGRGQCRRDGWSFLLRAREVKIVSLCAKHMHLLPHAGGMLVLDWDTDDEEAA